MGRSLTHRDAEEVLLTTTERFSIQHIHPFSHKVVAGQTNAGVDYENIWLSEVFNSC